MKVIISGGGTGGHIFPALAIADAIKAKRPDAEILFVGAQGKMEMERVPKAGYPIEGLWISGLQRSLSPQNLSFPLKVVSSLWKSRGILRRFQPRVAVGTGGFASGPLLEMAVRSGIPTLIQEQNAYAGITNKLLARRVDRICVAYPGMERYFPADKLLLTGNPVREDVLLAATDAAAARGHYDLAPDRPTVLVTGGSLGARTLNEALREGAALLGQHPDVQVLWQCGKFYEDAFSATETARLPNVRLVPFLDRMDLAYAAADVVVCRAGALTIAELCLLGKAAVLVPSPNVAEDHQTKNALALANEDAALVVRDEVAVRELLPRVLDLLKQPEHRSVLGRNAQKLARPGAARRIAEEVLRLGGEGVRW